MGSKSILAQNLQASVRELKISPSGMTMSKNANPREQRIDFKRRRSAFYEWHSQSSDLNPIKRTSGMTGIGLYTGDPLAI